MSPSTSACFQTGKRGRLTNSGIESLRPRRTYDTRLRQGGVDVAQIQALQRELMA